MVFETVHLAVLVEDSYRFFCATMITDKPNGNEVLPRRNLASKFNAAPKTLFNNFGMGFTSDSVLRLHFDNRRCGAARKNSSVLAYVARFILNPLAIRSRRKSTIV